MLHTAQAYGGMVVAPHHLAAEAGRDVLRDGGNAIEAMLAAAAAIAVVYPHMNGLGGDNFWLIHEPGETPLAIEACGTAANAATLAHYRDRGLAEIPGRGPLAALTVAGAVAGWGAAHALSQQRWGGRRRLADLLAAAIGHARDGFPVTRSQAETTADKRDGLQDVAGFADLFLPGGNAPSEGERFIQPLLAEVLEALGRDGADSFYRGDMARLLAHGLAAAGSPLRLADLESFQAKAVAPLSVPVAGHSVFNLPPPTQGLAALMILAIADRLGSTRGADESAYVHGLVEATKQAFVVRDRIIGEPLTMAASPAIYLQPAALDAMAAAIDPAVAAPWPPARIGGDTVWLGAVDREGRAVSFIQSLYWEFGSGIVVPGTGIVWQNRGMSFRLTDGHPNVLGPGRRPFHTIQPALARLSDGRVMAYGTMGGDGQPQTQARLFTGHVLRGMGLQEVVSAPRWLLGRTWGEETSALRLESRFAPEVVHGLRQRGHDVRLAADFDSVMGHAGALVGWPDGRIEGAADPRGDGQACGV
ncbi:MAG: gamma-glutamyltransferase [Alphaproteobacteria bacterium]